ncbi:MerR family transcriptional regulator [Allokutzneria sp. NRRL B-24872]|uniref:MerR family transcriptional regulator n=1 Tax=Allokutzneria sp. NRRL B-24872 TaxID=1137961 RepID=UPI000A35EB4B|nr:MerR family transcriptional regulator [Allokutzneria sp. NRRL B-24872]
MRLRPVDLARAAGISTQQVRNYADAGVLPPTPRTDSGYRHFGERHLDALFTYRALARGFGGDAARQVMHAVHEDDVPRALAVLDAGHAELHDQRRSLQEISDALEVIAGQGLDATGPPGSLRIGELAARLGVRTSALRVWEEAGLLAPQRDHATKYRTYDAADIRDARMIRMLRQGGYLLDQIRPVLEGLRESGSGDALREAITQRRAQLTWRATAMLEAAAHLHQYAFRTRSAP